MRRIWKLLGELFCKGYPDTFELFPFGCSLQFSGVLNS